MADRKFAVGDSILFREWNPTAQTYTGDDALATIVHLTEGGKFGLPLDICVFGIQVVG